MHESPPSLSRLGRWHSARSGPGPQLLWKTACVAYAAVLAWLLLTPRPLRPFETQAGLFQALHALEPAAHLVSFTLLAALALLPRWAVPRRAVLLGLIACAVGTEFLQAVVPTRTPELADALQNLAGIAIGCAVVRLPGMPR